TLLAHAVSCIWRKAAGIDNVVAGWFADVGACWPVASLARNCFRIERRPFKAVSSCSHRSRPAAVAQKTPQSDWTIEIGRRARFRPRRQIPEFPLSVVTDRGVKQRFVDLLQVA